MTKNDTPNILTEGQNTSNSIFNPQPQKSPERTKPKGILKKTNKKTNNVIPTDVDNQIHLFSVTMKNTLQNAQTTETRDPNAPYRAPGVSEKHIIYNNPQAIDFLTNKPTNAQVQPQDQESLNQISDDIEILNSKRKESNAEIEEFHQKNLTRKSNPQSLQPQRVNVSPSIGTSPTQMYYPAQTESPRKSDRYNPQQPVGYPQQQPYGHNQPPVGQSSPQGLRQVLQVSPPLSPHRYNPQQPVVYPQQQPHGHNQPPVVQSSPQGLGRVLQVSPNGYNTPHYFTPMNTPKNRIPTSVPKNR